MEESICAVAPGRRYRIAAQGGLEVTGAADRASSRVGHVASGQTVVAAEVRRVGAGERVRLSAPAGWVDAVGLGDPPGLPVEMDFETFASRHRRSCAGDYHGLELPVSVEGVLDAGSAFLTAAFRAAGTIAPDNSVSAIVSLQPLGIPGASDNGLLTVDYLRDEPGLSRELFVKLPPADAVHAFRQLRYPNGEIEMMRLSQRRALPVPVARCYFADCSAFNQGYLLITERIGFGTGNIEPAHRKGYDFAVPDAQCHYDALVTALAILAAAHKRGELGDDIEDVFPFARATRDFAAIADPGPQVDKIVHFVSEIAPQLFDQSVTDPVFLQQWKADVLFGLEHKDAVIAHLLEDVDYTGLCHSNLNIDNAWYWRDEEGGSLQAGLLDWGGAGQMPFAQALSGMLMMPEPELHLPLVGRMIDMFVTEYARHGGPLLDRERLFFQYKASLFSTAICLFVTILADVVAMVPEAQWRGYSSLRDPQLVQMGLRSAVVWIDNVLREWTQPLTPGDACRAIVTRSA